MTTIKLLFLFTLGLFTISYNSYAMPVPESFADIVETLSPTVVNISSTQTTKNAANPPEELFSYNIPKDVPFNELPDLLKKFYGQENNESRDQQATSLGSGFIISEDGYIVTNNHVIDQADEITINFNDDSEAKAKVIGKDAKTDIALLKIETKKKLKYVKFGNSDAARVGDWVIAIGNPFGLGGSVSTGIISARARDINAGPFDDFIQTDAAINRGNSGGPLFNMAGEVIGVNSAIFSPSGGSIGIGFSVPTSLAEPVIKQLKETGYVKRGWLGVKIQTVTDEIAESIGLQKSNGALVLEVSKDSPAAKAGILSGDVITSFDGQEIAAMRRLPKIVAETPVGKKVPVVVWRNDKERTLVVTVALLEEEESVANSNLESDNQKEAGQDDLKASYDIFGVGVKDLTASLRERFNIGKEATGVLVTTIDTNSDATEKPIQVGDIISAINQLEIKNIAEAKEQVQKASDAQRKSLLLLVRRGDDALFVTIPIKKK
jgi:serine protease Do